MLAGVRRGVNRYRSVRWFLLGGVMLCLWLLAHTAGAQTSGGIPAHPAARGFSVGSPTPAPTCLPAWSHTSSPSPGLSVNDLRAIAAVSVDDVWAVGTFSDNSTDRQL